MSDLAVKTGGVSAASNVEKPVAAEKKLSESIKDIRDIAGVGAVASLAVIGGAALGGVTLPAAVPAAEVFMGCVAVATLAQVGVWFAEFGEKALENNPNPLK